MRESNDVIGELQRARDVADMHARTTGDGAEAQALARVEIVGETRARLDQPLQQRRFRDIQGARYHPLQQGPQAAYAGAMALGQPVATIY